MFHQLQQNANRRSGFPDCLLLILSVFTGTFFVYRDLGIRMFLGFGTLCLILLLHLLQRVQQNRPPVTQAIHLPFLMLAAVILLSFLRPSSRHDVDSGSYLISMLICCCFVYLAAPTADESRRTLKTLFLCGMGLAVFVVFFSIFEELFFDTLFHILSPTAQEYLLFFVPGGYAITLGGCTYTCYLMFFGMAACCGYVCSETWGKKSMLMLLACGFLLFALLLVGRRGELLGAVVCLAVLFFAMCPPRRRRLLLAASILLGAAMLGLVVLFLPQLKEISFLERYIVTIENLLNGQDVTTGRTTLYQVAFQGFLEHPILGIGWDQYHTLIPPHYLTNPIVKIEDTHCIYLQFLCETGIVGTVLIVAPLLYYYWQVCAQFRRLKQRFRESGELRLAFGLSVSSFMIQSFLLIVGIYDPNFQRIVFWCFYALSILLLIAALELEGHRPNDPVSRLLERLLPTSRKRG
jgi:O-antigen ligase